MKCQSCLLYNMGKRIGGVMVNVLAWSVVDQGFIGGVMVNMLAWSVVDHEFIRTLFG